MSHVLTLIADPRTMPLTDAIVGRVRDAVRGTSTDILSPGEAVDIFCADRPDGHDIAAALERAPIDAIATKARGRRKALLVADMDSTIVTTETIDELAAYAGLKDKIAAITKRSMEGELDFAQALRERVAMLKDVPLTDLAKTWEQVAFSPGARELVATMRAHNATTALVSGGFTYFTGRVAEALGFHVHRANVLLDDGVALTGEVGEPILDREAKLATLRELAAARNLKIAGTLAVGDGANDLAMVREAGLGVAYKAKPIVAREARAEIVHTSLRALLFAQGYRATQIVGG